MCFHHNRSRCVVLGLGFLLSVPTLSACATTSSSPRTRPERPRPAAPPVVADEGNRSTACSTTTGSVAELTQRGVHAEQQGHQDEARACYDAAIAQDPAATEAPYARGAIARLEGDRAGAMAWFRRATEDDPRFAAAWIALRTTELEEADALLASATKETTRETPNAGGPGPRAGGGDSLEIYRRAITLAPHVLPPYLDLADALRRNGDPAAAAQTLERAREHIGDVPIVLEALTTANLEAGETVAAMSSAMRLSDVSPDDPAARTLLEDARRSHERAVLPSSFWTLDRQPRVTREELAALLVVNVLALQSIPSPPRPPIVNDLNTTWADDYIRRVSALGLMEIFANHEFAPQLPVTRGMLAEVVGRALSVARYPGASAGPPVNIVDVPQEHLAYDAVQSAVRLGILELDERSRFRLLSEVSGRDAVAAIDRLADFLESHGLPATSTHGGG